MSKHEYDGKIVVVAWEHKHIASHKLEKDYRGQDVTFRQLLRLGQAPESWSDTNYDYFWIVDYAPGNPNPVKFQAVKQTFTSPFNAIPRLIGRLRSRSISKRDARSRFSAHMKPSDFRR